MLSIINIIWIFPIPFKQQLWQAIHFKYNYIGYLIKYILHFSWVGNNLVASCEGSTKYGPVVHVDFLKINRPCTCNVTAPFVGQLLVVSRVEIMHGCNTRIYISNTVTMGCPLSSFSSLALDVQRNQSLDVRAE